MGKTEIERFNQWAKDIIDMTTSDYTSKALELMQTQMMLASTMYLYNIDENISLIRDILLKIAEQKTTNNGITPDNEIIVNKVINSLMEKGILNRK